MKQFANLAGIFGDRIPAFLYNQSGLYISLCGHWNVHPWNNTSFYQFKNVNG